MGVRPKMRRWPRNVCGSNSASMHVKGSDLDRVRFIERVRSCQSVHDAVAEVLAMIVESGVTAPTLAALQTKIDVARGFVTAPRNTVVDKATATAQLTEEIRKLDEILNNQIEPLVALLEETNREFWLKYRSAGKEVSTGGGQGEDDAADATPAAPATPPVAGAAT
jgi:hypothetical protein